MIVLLIVAFLIVLIGVFILVVLSRQRASLGVLAISKPVYQDTTKIPGEVLNAKTLPLVGKPDYLIRHKDEIIPVEVKTGRSPREFFLGHNMQLMAYCFLVEETFGVRPHGGIIKYNDKEIKLAYTKEAEESVITIVNEILAYKKSKQELHCKHARHYNHK